MHNKTWMFMFVALFLGTLFSPLTARSSDFSAKRIYLERSPSVVVIKASNPGSSGMIGAGSLVATRDGEGFFVTNAHVVVDKSTGRPYPKVGVFLKPDVLTGSFTRDLTKYHAAKVAGFSQDLDLALLWVADIPEGLGVVELADPAQVAVGEEVVAIGHPEQGGFWSLTYGRISGQMKDYQGVAGKDVFQTDTSVNRGNSGGPLLDGRGYMVAVNSNIARIGKGGIAITGVNFSIKSSVVKDWLNDNGYTVAYGASPNEASEPQAQEGADDLSTKKEPMPEALEKAVTSKAPDAPARVVERGDAQELGEGMDGDRVRSEDESERFTTPARPYDYDAVLKAAEQDLEQMMEEMRTKIRRKDR